MPMFGASDAGLLVPAARVQTLWREIVATPRPPEVPRNAPAQRAPDVPTELGKPSWTGTEESKKARSAGGLGCVAVIAVFASVIVAGLDHIGEGLVIAALVVGIVALANWSGLSDLVGEDDVPLEKSQEDHRLQETLRVAEHQLSTLINEWSRTFARSIFDSALEDLNADRQELVQLPETRRKQLAELRDRTALRKRDTYLRRFSIESAGFSWYGSEQAGALASHGLHTAADVMHALGTLHRYLDNAASTELKAWYEAKAAEVMVDPSEPLNPGEVAYLEERLRERCEVLLKRLREGPARLQNRSDEIVGTRDRLLTEIEVAREVVRIARHELNAHR
jgi:DNA-binding helix-hairpin-helix protein with protein kinase domain